MSYPVIEGFVSAAPTMTNVQWIRYYDLDLVSSLTLTGTLRRSTVVVHYDPVVFPILVHRKRALTPNLTATSILA